MTTYFNKNNNTIIKRSRDVFCTNCGNTKHNYKNCTEPITSWGVILVSYGNMKQPTHEKKIDLLKSSTESKRVHIESDIDRLIVSYAYHNVTFLMVSRKHSVGYVEFIRGRYRPEKIDQVIYLFKQMMQSEIDKIRDSLSMEDGFEYLWKDFWGKKHDIVFYQKDKQRSKSNYELMCISNPKNNNTNNNTINSSQNESTDNKETKNNNDTNNTNNIIIPVDGPELDLDFIVNNVKAEYDIEEWGFPKGRRDKSESDLECAIREFKEESGYTDKDFRVITEIKPLIEEFNGTNGVSYRHVYYVAELLTDKSPRNDITDSQRDEIGNIKFMNFITALESIREYHIPRKNILEKVFTYYIDRLILSNRNNDIFKSYNYDYNQSNIIVVGKNTFDKDQKEQKEQKINK